MTRQRYGQNICEWCGRFQEFSLYLSRLPNNFAQKICYCYYHYQKSWRKRKHSSQVNYNDWLYLYNFGTIWNTCGWDRWRKSGRGWKGDRLEEGKLYNVNETEHHRLMIWSQNHIITALRTFTLPDKVAKKNGKTEMLPNRTASSKLFILHHLVFDSIWRYIFAPLSCDERLLLSFGTRDKLHKQCNLCWDSVLCREYCN